MQNGPLIRIKYSCSKKLFIKTFIKESDDYTVGSLKSGMDLFYTLLRLIISLIKALLVYKAES
jgi:hypothetical protein